jgi:hypothetical protein
MIPEWIFDFTLESPRLVEVRIKTRVIEKICKQGGQYGYFYFGTKLFWEAVEFVLGDKKIKIYKPLIFLLVRL